MRSKNPVDFKRLLSTLVCVFVASLVALPLSDAATVLQAIRHSQQTGKPIFAVAGASYCPACQKLMNTLNSDTSLRPYIEQFVPLKINAQSDDYKIWKKFFPPKRSAIPALFIVTPQGKELYSAVGALPTERLQKVLLTSLEKAERYPTKEQWQEIAATLKTAEQALDEHEIEAAAEKLQPILAGLQQMGTLLELEDTGREAVAKVNELATKQRTLLDESLQAMVSKGDLASALEVAALESLLEVIPAHRKSVKAAVKTHTREAESKQLLRQARELRQAGMLIHQDEAKSQRKGKAILKRIAKRYPNTEAAERAEQQLQALKE